MIDYVPFNTQEFYRWIQDRGDQTLRLEYPLNQESTVLDIGGYLGQWAQDINDRYGSTVIVFEPLSNLYNGLVYRFANNPKVIPYQGALSNINQEAEISISADASSLYDTAAESKELIKCVDIRDFFVNNSIESVDLIKINIEGAEYDLLERVIELGLHKKITNIQVQFHRFVENCKERRDFIIQELEKTHVRTWNYEWIWENWTLKK